MSVSVELQEYIYRLLHGAPAIVALTGGRIYDRVPEKPTFPYISFGAVDITSTPADCVDGEEHHMQIDVWSRSVGQVECKRIVDAVRKVIKNTDHQIAENAIVGIEFDQTQVVADPDGLTTHGIIGLNIMVELS